MKTYQLLVSLLFVATFHFAQAKSKKESLVKRDSSATASDDCKSNLARKFSLRSSITGENLTKAILKELALQSRPMSLFQKFVSVDPTQNYQLEITWDETKKNYRVVSTSNDQGKNEGNVAHPEEALKKSKFKLKLINSEQKYFLKDNQFLYVLQSDKKIVRVVQGTNFNCEFTDFTSCQCLK